MIFSTLLHISILLICSTVVNYSECTSTNISKLEWVKSTEVVYGDLEPAGEEGPEWNIGTLYICRGSHPNANSYTPGKYHVYKKGEAMYCDFSVNGGEIRSADYEFLTYLNGTVSWIQGEEIQQITNRHVQGGIDHDNGEEVYICRSWH